MRLTFWTDDQAASLAGTSVHHLDDIDQLLSVCYRPITDIIHQSGGRINVSFSLSLIPISTLQQANTYILLLFPVPKSIMICLLR